MKYLLWYHEVESKSWHCEDQRHSTKEFERVFSHWLGTATLEEEAVDTFCALAAHEKMRPNLLDKVKRLWL